MKRPSFASGYLFLFLILSPTLVVSYNYKNQLDIDFTNVEGCFLGIDIPSSEPSPVSWCKLNLSFETFLKCMDKNLNLRLLQGRYIDQDDKQFLMDCLEQCYVDPIVTQTTYQTTRSSLRGFIQQIIGF